MSDRNFQCVICENTFEGFGNNPYPLSEDGRCCNACNIDVIVARFRNIVSKEEDNIEKERQRLEAIKSYS